MTDHSQDRDSPPGSRRQMPHLSGGRRALGAALAAILATVGLVAVTTASTAAAAPTTFNATADAYVSHAAAGSNYGGSSTLIANAKGPVDAHLKFVVSGSNGATSATLRVYSTSSGKIKTQAYAEPSDWTETGITYSNQPARGALVGGLSTLKTNNYSTLTVPLNGDGTYAYVLTSKATAARNMTSRETSTPPQLILSGTTVTITPTSTSTTTTSTTTIAPTSTTTATSEVAPSPTSSNVAPGARPSKVLVVIEENHTAASALKDMPYLESLTAAHGQATNYQAVTHPSLPNYLAIAGGSTFGVTDDKPPANHPITGNSVFDDALAAGSTAKTYADAMPKPCALKSSGTYAVKHNPWAYFSDPAARANCQRFDLPAGTPTSGALHDDINAGTLPNVGLLIPDMCHDGHDCPLAKADAWLQTWIPVVMQGPDYQSGKLTILVTFDEDDNSGPNTVLTTVIAPTVDHRTATTELTHYSLARYLAELGGPAPLGTSANAPSLRDAFGI